MITNHFGSEFAIRYRPTGFYKSLAGDASSSPITSPGGGGFPLYFDIILQGIASRRNVPPDYRHHIRTQGHR